MNPKLYYSPLTVPLLSTFSSSNEMAGCDTRMTDAYTVVRTENVLILSSDKDKQVMQ
jgi:hypothetical protein